MDDPKQASGLSLLKSNGRQCLIAPRVVHNGQAYAPLALHPSLRRALRLPLNSSPIKSTAELFGELVAIMRKFTDLGEASCFLLIFFVFSSWLAGCLPVPINLAIWSPTAADAARVLLLLSCFCRQALALSGTCANDLALLPPELQPTLLIFRPAAGRRTREVLSSYGWRGFHAARSGSFAEFVGSVALSTDAPLKDCTLDPMIEIAIPPSRRALPVLNQRVQGELAREVMPKLLRYRLMQHKTAVEAGSAETGFATPSSQLAAGLRACFADEPKLREQQLALLIETGQNGHDPRATDPRVPLVEALLVRSHEKGREKVYVAEIAADLNAILAVNDLEVSCRMVGSILKSVGVQTRKLDRKGRGIMLDPSTRKLIHDLARVHDVPAVETAFPGCAECSPAQLAETQGLVNE